MNMFFKLMMALGMLVGSCGSLWAMDLNKVKQAVDIHQKKQMERNANKEKTSQDEERYRSIGQKIKSFFNIDRNLDIGFRLKSHLNDLDYFDTFFEYLNNMAHVVDDCVAVDLQPLEELMLDRISKSNIQSRPKPKVNVKIKNVTISPLACGLVSAGLLAVGGALGWAAHTFWN
jgi:hypothetical protein